MKATFKVVHGPYFSSVTRRFYRTGDTFSIPGDKCGPYFECINRGPQHQPVIHDPLIEILLWPILIFFPLQPAPAIPVPIAFVGVSEETD